MQEVATYRDTVEIAPYQDGNFCRVSGKFCRNRGGTVSADKQPIRPCVVLSIDDGSSWYGLVSVESDEFRQPDEREGRLQ